MNNKYARYLAVIALHVVLEIPHLLPKISSQPAQLAALIFDKRFYLHQVFMAWALV